jgi:hypothetical protein
VKHVVVTLVVVPLVAAAAFGLLNWFFRRRGASFSLVASIMARWVVAYMAWALVVGLLHEYGLAPDGRPALSKWGLAPFALVAGVVQYRLVRAGARQHAERVFVWGQIAWLVLVLVDHGVLGH